MPAFHDNDASKSLKVEKIENETFEKKLDWIELFILSWSLFLKPFL